MSLHTMEGRSADAQRKAGPTLGRSLATCHEVRLRGRDRRRTTEEGQEERRCRLVRGESVRVSTWKQRTMRASKRDAAVASCAGGMVRARNESRGLSLIHISEPTRRTPISYAVFC